MAAALCEHFCSEISSLVSLEISAWRAIRLVFPVKSIKAAILLSKSL